MIKLCGSIIRVDSFATKLRGNDIMRHLQNLHHHAPPCTTLHHQTSDFMKSGGARTTKPPPGHWLSIMLRQITNGPGIAS